MTIDKIEEKNNTMSKKPTAEEAEALEKIAKVLEARGEELEKAAEQIAPEFDCEKEAETLEKITRVLEAKGEELERAAEEIDPEFIREETAEPAQEAAEPAQGDAVPAKEDTVQADEVPEADEDPQTDEPLPAAEISPSRYPAPRYEARTALGKYFLKDRHQMVLGAVLLLAIVMFAWQGLDYLIPETVHVQYFSLEEMQEKDFKTRAKTVGELREELVEAGYEIEKTDAVSPAEDKLIRNGMNVKIMKAVPSEAKIWGKKETIWLINGTVREVLDFNEISYDKDDEISPSLKTHVDVDTKIKVDEVHYVKRTKQEKVKAQDYVVLDPSLTSGVQEKTKGNDGEGVFNYTYKYVNKEKKETKKEVEKWITEPHDNTLRLGTASTGQSGKYIVARTFTANCTAYTARPGAGGALGEGVHLGTCAVDPTFVSYRSEMWIEGYGYAYANDCGGAVKGNIVDLFMNSTAECIRWGRRNCTAYVLKPID